MIPQDTGYITHKHVYNTLETYATHTHTHTLYVSISLIPHSKDKVFQAIEHETTLTNRCDHLAGK